MRTFLSVCGPYLEKSTYITTASLYLPYAFDISPNAKSGHSLVLCVLKGRHEVICEVTFNVIHCQLIIFMGILVLFMVSGELLDISLQLHSYAPDPFRPNSIKWRTKGRLRQTKQP